MLVVERPNSLVDGVVKAIRAEIAGGRFAAASRLPTEQQLAEQLDVSRSVVREAVSQLKADGVLTVRRGSGSYVSSNPAGTVFRLPQDTGSKLHYPQLFEMRLWIETQAARAAAWRRSKDDLKRMSQALKQMQVKRKELDAAAAAAADIDFHRAILAATKNDYFVAFHDFLSAQLAAERRLAWGTGGTDEAQLEHRELYDAIANQDDVSAALAAERHLRNAAQRMGIKLPDAGERTA